MKTIPNLSKQKKPLTGLKWIALVVMFLGLITAVATLTSCSFEMTPLGGIKIKSTGKDIVKVIHEYREIKIHKEK